LCDFHWKPFILTGKSRKGAGVRLLRTPLQCKSSIQKKARPRMSGAPGNASDSDRNAQVPGFAVQNLPGLPRIYSVAFCGRLIDTP
jgi:hypothetical protein